MWPTLFEAGGVQLHNYGLLIAIGFVAGIVLAAREARRIFGSPEGMLDLCFWILVGGILGARLLYVALDARAYAEACSEAASFGGIVTALWRCSAPLHLWEGGMVFYGGVIGAVAAVAIHTRRRRAPFLRTLDVLAPSLAIGHFFGRLGCYAAGCCFGKLAPGGFGARFPVGSVAWGEVRDRGIALVAGDRTPPLHATQLYEAGGELLIFFLLLGLRRRKRIDGELTAVYLIAYSAMRSFVELFRGDLDRGFLVRIFSPGIAKALGLPPAEPLLFSTSQLVSLVIATVAIALYVILRQRRARPSPPVGAASG